MTHIQHFSRATSRWCSASAGHRLLCSVTAPSVRHTRAADPAFMRTNASLCPPHISNLVPLRCFGQPAAQTHPHLISYGEVTPNITKEEYKHRRSLLVTVAKSMFKRQNADDNHIFVFPSACKVFMTNDIPYPFRQNSDFLYLSGFQEPNSVLVVHSVEGSTSSADNHKSVLFVPKKEPYKELWEGPSSGTEGAVKLTGVDCAYNYNELEKYLFDYCNNHHKFMLWYDFTTPVQDHFHRNIMSQMIGQERHKAVESTRRLIHSLRVKKSPAEVDLMKQSVEVAAEAFVHVMKYSRSQIQEALLWAKMDFECRVRGAQCLAYPPVVAGGNRANTIHYTANNQMIADGELVLMDAGCELHGYSSDITRTWPVNGKFSPAQCALYEAILKVQTACIALCTPQNSLDEVYRQMLALLGLQLQSLRIVPVDIPVTEVIKRARELCPHHVGHYLGMDVHDCEDVSRSAKFEPGMIITIEPGIYVQKDDMSVPEEYRGIGIRIEDNILITTSKPVNLSQRCPKTVEEIEKLMKDAEP